MHMKRCLFIFIFCGVLGICLVNEGYTQKVEIEGRTCQPDTVFFKIEGDLNNPQVMRPNLVIYYKALRRMENYLFIEDNQLQWNIKNGAEIYISENIFQYVCNRWNKDNELIKEGHSKIINKDGRYCVRTRYKYGIPQINVKVVDIHNELIVGVKMMVYDSLHQFVKDGGLTTTESRGTTHIDVPRYGKYHIKFSKNGYETMEKEVLLEDVQTRNTPVFVMKSLPEFSGKLWWIIFGLIVLSLGIWVIMKKGRIFSRSGSLK